MFEKKNQNILSEHYSSLIDHASTLASTSQPTDDDMFTLKRVDHTLSDDEDNDSPMSAELSKRKLKAGESRKAGLKNKGVGSKLVFDEAGEAHELYELVDEEEERKGKKGDEKEKFVAEERERLSKIDVEDREVAKEKKREKKRKMKDRERDVSPTPFRFWRWGRERGRVVGGRDEGGRVELPSLSLTAFALLTFTGGRGNFWIGYGLGRRWRRTPRHRYRWSSFLGRRDGRRGRRVDRSATTGKEEEGSCCCTCGGRGRGRVGFEVAGGLDLRDSARDNNEKNLKDSKRMTRTRLMKLCRRRFLLFTCSR